MNEVSNIEIKLNILDKCAKYVYKKNLRKKTKLLNLIFLQSNFLDRRKMKYLYGGLVNREKAIAIMCKYRV